MRIWNRNDGTIGASARWKIVEYSRDIKRLRCRFAAAGRTDAQPLRAGCGQFALFVARL
jgi:hypothetical protein